MENKNDIIKKLEEYRVTSGKSYEKISREIGISFGTVYRWCKASRNGKPSISDLGAIRLEEYLKRQNS